MQEEHWNALFKKLGMPKNVRLDTLTVGHILDAMDAVAANLAWLKDLHSRAQVGRCRVASTRSLHSMSCARRTKTLPPRFRAR
jgi:hypothetical protein